MRPGMPRKLGAGLVIALVALATTGCKEGPKRRGPQNYHEYRAEMDPRYRAPEGDGEGGGLSSDDGEFGPSSGTVDVTAADAIRSGNVPGSGSVIGRVSYTGAAKRKTLDLSKDVWCSSNHTVQSEDLVVDSEGGLKNVLVFVSRGFNRFDFEVPGEAAVLNQDGCKYIPHVLTIMAGQELKIVNNDATSHNYHFTGRANDEINKTQPKKGQVDYLSDLINPELKATFRCDIHPWMVAPTHVMSHPYYAVTNETGAFELKGLPPGTYEVSFLHERPDMKCEPLTVTVEPGAAASLNAQFSR